MDYGNSMGGRHVTHDVINQVPPLTGHDVSGDRALLDGLDPQGETIDTLLARLPAFPRAAVEEALTMLSDAGVLRRASDPAVSIAIFS